MQHPTAAYLDNGTRLHLHHGPIDLIIGADGPGRAQAFDAAIARFETVLTSLVAELPLLRSRLTPDSPEPTGPIARCMVDAARPFCGDHFVTPMIAVAGAVADTILAAMLAATPLRRAYVNNGGDIALHLSGDAQFSIAMADHMGRDLGRVTLTPQDGIHGIATSGRHGRSLSLGIADSVTVLARDAACADAAATLIANAVDLPAHRGIRRQPACTLDPDSDLGVQPVAQHVPRLAAPDIQTALAAGQQRANTMLKAGHIIGAALFLQGHSTLIGHGFAALPEKDTVHA